MRFAAAWSQALLAFRKMNAGDGFRSCESLRKRVRSGGMGTGIEESDVVSSSGL